MWRDDEVSPQSLFFSYRKNIKLFWSPHATYRLCIQTGELMDIVMHQDETVIMLKNKGEFGTQFWRNSIPSDVSFREE